MPDSSGYRSKRFKLGWPAALAAVGGGVVALAAGLWLVRLPLAEGWAKSALAGQGVESDFQLLSLDFGGAVISELRLGPRDAPDLSARRVEAQIAWSGLSPRLQGLRVDTPRLRASLDRQGRFSLGQLDGLSFGDGGGAFRRPSLPRMRLTILDGQAELIAPMGALQAGFSAEGRIGEDFEAEAALTPGALRQDNYALTVEEGLVRIEAGAEGPQAQWRFAFPQAQWGEARLDGLRFSGAATATTDLSQARADARALLDRLEQGENSVDSLDLAAQAHADLPEEDAPRWTAQAEARLDDLAAGDNRFAAPRLDAHLSGEGGEGGGDWALEGRTLMGLGLVSRAPGARGSLSFSQAEGLRARGEALLARSELSAEARADLRQTIPNLGGSPLGPTLEALETGLDRAAAGFDLTLPVSLSMREGENRLDLGPADIAAASGAAIRFQPGDEGLRLAWPPMRLHGAAILRTEGGGLPDLALDIAAADWTSGAALTARGALQIEDWSAGEARLSGGALSFNLTAPPGAPGELTIEGPLSMTGPLADGEARDLALDLNLSVAWGEGWRVRPADPCTPARFAALEFAGLVFQNGAFALCMAEDRPLVAADAQKRLSGGFFIDGLDLQGRMSGENAQPARLRAGRLEGRFSGTQSNAVLDVQIARPDLAIRMAPERPLEVNLQSLTAQARFGGGDWRVDGGFGAGALSDPSLPGRVSAIAGRWSAAPENNGAVLRVSAGEARIDASSPPNDAEDQRPLFQTLRLADVGAVLRGGVLDAEGRILLQADNRDLARFSARHVIENGEGQAHVEADALTFDQNFQPYHLSELARGIIANVRGPASASADLSWSGEDMRAEGALRLQGVSLATATIPVIENVQGEVHFDDLFNLSTPPGQALTVETLNPGVAVYNGRLQFQLLDQERVSLEGAQFDFAAGQLRVLPALVTLGAEETQLELALDEVDVAALIEQLNIPDLTATGTVEGSFPLTLTKRTAFIRGGVLRASEQGGTIAYTGHAGDSTTGAARLAFQALTSFRYDDLSLTLDGDLNGELVSAINFTGYNRGDNVEIGELAAVPGLSDVRVSGVPFAFNVQITAPFRALADTAQSLTDARGVVSQALEREPEEGENSQTERSVDVQVEPLR